MIVMRFKKIELVLLRHLEQCFPSGTGASFNELCASAHGVRAWNPDNRVLVSAALQRLKKHGYVYFVPKSLTAAGCPALWIATKNDRVLR